MVWSVRRGIVWLPMVLLFIGIVAASCGEPSL